MDWNQVCIETNEQAADIVSSVLIDAGAAGAEMEGGTVIPAQHDEYRADVKPTENVVVKAYFGEDGFEETLKFIKDHLDLLKRSAEIDAGTLSISVKKIPDTDWNENFRKHFTTFRAAGNIVIKPSWEDYKSKEADIVIEIDPGMAFGSGTHETTRMCLELIQKYMPPEADVMDIGCGSGILGIACTKLGAKSVQALDYDPVCVKVTRENAKANNVEIQVLQSDLLKNVGDGRYDLVVANIVADIIIRLNNDITKYMKPEAAYIVSGIIEDRLGEVKCSLEENSLDIVEVLSMGDWRAIATRPKGASS